MLRFVSLVLITAYAVHAQSEICDGYRWGVVIEKAGEPGGIAVYNQFILTPNCGGPWWVQSSTLPDPPTSIRPFNGDTYQCEVPEIQYYCGTAPVATCCGKLE